jgi:hypothetical protein
MFFGRFLTMAVALVTLMALSSCGGSSGPTAKNVAVPTPVSDTTVTPESDPGIVRLPTEDVPEPTDVSTSGGISTTAPPIADGTAPSIDELGAVAPVEVDPSDPILLATLAAFERNETVISSAALVTDPVTGDRMVLTRDGLYARIDGSLSIADLAAYVNNDVLGDYENAATFSQSDAVGIVGLATPLTDLRTNGDASFEGGASGFVITAKNGIDLIKGRSVVDVVFGVNSVSVTLDQFEGVSQITGLVVDSPITEMILNNATIANGGFSGGTLVLRDDSGSVDLTGAGTKTLSQGQFFGLDADGTTPDEVGGIVLSEGASGIVFGTFIAD